MQEKGVKLTKYSLPELPEVLQVNLPRAGDAPITPSADRQPRILGLDICRSAAILLTMFSHALAEGHAQDFYAFTDAGLIWLRLLLQVSPPIFIILFGSMLEIVYRPRIEAGQPLQTTARLLTRALQCYLLYVVTLLAMLAAGLSSPGFTLRCALFLGVTPYGDILKFFTLALAFAPAMIFLRNRLGFGVLIAASLAILIAHPLIAQIVVPQTASSAELVNPVIGFLIGGGSTFVGGPSVLHSLCFVIWGMLIGRAVIMLTRQGSSHQDILKAAGILAAMFAASALALLMFWDLNAPAETLQALSNLTFRNANLSIYFAFGLASTLVAVLLCLAISDGMGLRIGQSITFAGKTSLFTFSFGNALLYLAPVMALSLTGSWIYTFVLFFLVCLQSYTFQWLQTSRDNPVAARFQVMLGWINGRVSWLPKRVAPNYVSLLGWR